MSFESNPADIRRGIVPQQERPVGQKRLREPKRVKLEFKHFEGEEWQTWAKYHSADDAMKARKGMMRSYARFNEQSETTWRIDGKEVK
jgi:hypothetical protein